MFYYYIFFHAIADLTYPCLIQGTTVLPFSGSKYSYLLFVCLHMQRYENILKCNIIRGAYCTNTPHYCINQLFALHINSIGQILTKCRKYTEY